MSASTTTDAAPDSKPKPSIREEAAAWFAAKDFTTDWFSVKVGRWARYLSRYRSRPAEVLEVGSYEGRSAVFILNYLPQCRLTCIDVFPPDLETRFDANLAEFGDRMTKLKGSAVGLLDELVRAERRYDIIYLDAGKRRDHVLAMSLIAWPLLRHNGLMIWDDYEWGKDKDPEKRPHDAIDTFLGLHEPRCEVLYKGDQVFVKKIKPAA